MPYWTAPTDQIEKTITDIIELIVVVNYIPEWELTANDCRRLTQILKEMLSALEAQMIYRKQVDGTAE